jgi:hypothetical protein
MGFPLRAKRQHSTPIREVVAPTPPPELQPVFSLEEDCIIKTPTVLNYVAPHVTKARISRDSKGHDSDAGNSVIWQEAVAWIQNGRKCDLTLHANGFELLENASFDSNTIDFLDKNVVIDQYYPHCENLLRGYLESVDGAKVNVYAFDHNVRLQNKGAINPLGIVHGDYTKISAPRRIQLLSEAPKTNDVLRERLGDTPLLHPDVVQECLAKKRRYALINVWRSIDRENPVQSLPLACMDARNSSNGQLDECLRTLEIEYADRVGENYLVVPSDTHSWYYFPHMEHQEALLIKQWDSEGDFAKNRNNNVHNINEDDERFLATFSIHSAFVDPTSPPEAPPRQSIEVRCVAIWD